LSALRAARTAGLRTAFDMDYRASSWQSPAEAGAEARSERVEAYYRDEYVFAPKCPVQVVSTIGAGDGFAAGLLYGLVRGLSLDECLRHGNAVAAIVVSRISCSDAMPYLKELNEFLALTPYAGTHEGSVEASRLKEGP
jgi:sugar/nucleoside kinase (ribokinase family)